MLNSDDPVDISVWRADGSILKLRNIISLRHSFQRDKSKGNVNYCVIPENTVSLQCYEKSNSNYKNIY